MTPLILCVLFSIYKNARTAKSNQKSDPGLTKKCIAGMASLYLCVLLVYMKIDIQKVFLKLGAPLGTAESPDDSQLLSDFSGDQLSIRQPDWYQIEKISYQPDINQIFLDI
ncbi:hypothetical protein RhiirA4_425750 [Rhizophagus irregularis]|uniref:Uncharacterized protein n=1 Tax=Rhizophagus irregularis TaxID=588596 RepID=A0A2I1H2G2_9GLOM|nr:hypothetical protein RhiirA4_425750 [Rhizophagus irregularis]